jgi:hypothetical protein
MGSRSDAAVAPRELKESDLRRLIPGLLFVILLKTDAAMAGSGRRRHIRPLIGGAKILEMQARHPKRQIWAPGEFDTWVGREQTACGRLGNAFLALWLNDQKYPVNKANWLAEKQ